MIKTKQKLQNYKEVSFKKFELRIYWISLIRMHSEINRPISTNIRRTYCTHVVYCMHAEFYRQSCLRKKSLVPDCNTPWYRKGKTAFGTFCAAQKYLKKWSVHSVLELLLVFYLYIRRFFFHIARSVEMGLIIHFSQRNLSNRNCFSMILV